MTKKSKRNNLNIDSQDPSVSDAPQQTQQWSSYVLPDGMRPDMLQLTQETQSANAQAKHAALSGYPVTPKDRLIPELRDKYNLLTVLGRGTQGTVFLAESKETGQKVAIKLLNIDSVSAWKTYDLFQREVDTLSKLNMPGIAHFYEAAEHLADDDPGACIVQEFISGKTLAEMMKLGHRFSLARIFEIALQLLELLDKLHHNDPPIIHRDIKPSNIILTPSPQGFNATLIDFGAVANPQIQSGGSTVAGTYGYMPPEQITGNPVPESDIYALGVTIISMISGVPPIDMQVKDFRLIIDPLLENIPPQIVPVLRQMTDPLVKNRLTDYAKLKEIFSAFAQDNYVIPSLSPIAPLEKSEFEKRLAEVRSLAQSGNVELWQQLPETTPRQIPDNYANLQIRDIKENHKVSPIKQILGSKIITSLLIFLLIAFCIIFPFSFTPTSIFGSNAPIALIFFITLAILITAIITNISCAHSVSERNHLIELYKQQFDNSEIYKDEYLELLKNGRRSMATVISVEQEELPLNSFELTDTYVASQPPAFKIRYKFNPPDDDNPDDLIRSYVASAPPDIHVGDPLPILYLIKEYSARGDAPANTGPKAVSSMPFPFPFKDVVAYDRIVSKSE